MGQQLGEMNLTSLKEAITSVLTDVHTAIDNGVQLNESQTQTVVIEPLLKTLGYAVWEYQKTAAETYTGTIPDYTILPNTACEWFLEVKKWQLSLTDKEASQAVMYAFNRGKRWAILTNGDEWRIYDAHCKEQLTSKCIYVVKSLDSDNAIEVISLLTKESMQHDMLAASYRTRILIEAVQHQLTTANSEAIKSIRKAISSTSLLNVTNDEVIKAIKTLFHNTNISPVTIPSIVPTGSITPLIPLIDAEPPSISDLANKIMHSEHQQVAAVLFPNSTEKLVKNWRDVTMAILEWSFSKYDLPALPFLCGTSAHAKRYFLNTEAQHGDGEEFRASRSMVVNGQTIFVNVNISATGFCHILNMLMKEISVDPCSIRIRMCSR